MTWHATIASMTNPDATLDVSARTLEDLVWRVQVVIIDDTDG